MYCKNNTVQNSYYKKKKNSGNLLLLCNICMISWHELNILYVCASVKYLNSFCNTYGKGLTPLCPQHVKNKCHSLKYSGTFYVCRHTNWNWLKSITYISNLPFNKSRPTRSCCHAKQAFNFTSFKPECQPGLFHGVRWNVFTCWEQYSFSGLMGYTIIREN